MRTGRRKWGNECSGVDDIGGPPSFFACRDDPTDVINAGTTLSHYHYRVAGGPSGRGTLFIDIKFRVLTLYKLLILKRNSQFEVNKRLSMTRWATLYCFAPRSRAYDVVSYPKLVPPQTRNLDRQGFIWLGIPTEKSPQKQNRNSWTFAAVSAQANWHFLLLFLFNRIAVPFCCRHFCALLLKWPKWVTVVHYLGPLDWMRSKPLPFSISASL